jgi:D-alanyl-D-alanine carboxypeptidase
MKQLKDTVPLPQVSAEAWCVFDTDTEKPLIGKLMNHKRECASLTKMMTFLVSW